MKDSSDDKYAGLNPEILKLVHSLERLPEYLEERRRKIEARREFVRFVFEDACRKAGILQNKLHPD